MNAITGEFKTYAENFGNSSAIRNWSENSNAVYQYGMRAEAYLLAAHQAILDHDPIPPRPMPPLAAHHHEDGTITYGPDGVCEPVPEVVPPPPLPEGNCLIASGYELLNGTIVVVSTDTVSVGTRVAWRGREYDRQIRGGFANGILLNLYVPVGA